MFRSDSRGHHPVPTCGSSPCAFEDRTALVEKGTCECVLLSPAKVPQPSLCGSCVKVFLGVTQGLCAFSSVVWWCWDWNPGMYSCLASSATLRISSPCDLMGYVCAQSATLEEKGPWVKVQSRLQEAGRVSSLGRAGLLILLALSCHSSLFLMAL